MMSIFFIKHKIVSKDDQRKELSKSDGIIPIKSVYTHPPDWTHLVDVSTSVLIVRATSALSGAPMGLLLDWQIVL